MADIDPWPDGALVALVLLLAAGLLIVLLPVSAHRLTARPNPAADYDLLSRLAAQTKDAGGRLVSPEELPALIRQLRERRQESEVEVQTSWQLGDTAIDAWLFLLGLVSLLSAEWGLRKKWGVV